MKGVMMAQILDSLPTNCDNRLLCCYSNADRKIKMARITNTPNRYVERVVLPGERLLFKALPESRLELYVTNLSTVALVEVTTCDRLAVRTAQTARRRIVHSMIALFSHQ